MKKYWLVLFFRIIFNNCEAQKGNDLLKDFTYYTPSSNKWTLEIKLSGDSLCRLKIKGGDTKDKYQQKIVGEEKRGDYFFVYLEVNSLVTINIASQAPAQINPAPTHLDAVILHFSKDKETLSLLSEPMICTSVEQVKSFYADIQLEDKYLTTWYSEAEFASFTRYPDILNADKATIQKVADEWIADLKQNANKMHQTKSFSLTDNLSRVLINNHLNPLGGEIDFNKKLAEYHIALSSLPLNNRTLPKTDTNKSKRMDDRAIIH